MTHPGYSVSVYRERLGLTQAELGERCEPPLQQQMVSRIERGSKRLLLTQARALAKALEVTLDDLTEGVDR